MGDPSYPAVWPAPFYPVQTFTGQPQPDFVYPDPCAYFSMFPFPVYQDNFLLNDTIFDPACALYSDDSVMGESPFYTPPAVETLQEQSTPAFSPTPSPTPSPAAVDDLDAGSGNEELLQLSLAVESRMNKLEELLTRLQEESVSKKLFALILLKLTVSSSDEKTRLETSHITYHRP